MRNFEVFVLRAGIIMTVGLVIGALFGMMAWECSAKTKDIGFNHRYGPMAGCQIEVQDGRWIPLESYYFKEE